MISENSILRGWQASYRITRPLPGGAFGSTYVAFVENLEGAGGSEVVTSTLLHKDMPVVIKAPPPPDDDFNLPDQRDFIRRVNEALGKEYRVLPRLNRIKGTARVLDAGLFSVELRDGPQPSFFLASEYVQGIRLDQWIQDRTEQLSADDFFQWARKLVEGLGEIHRAGVVHGDIWQNNIIVRDDEPVFIDFGQSVIRSEIRSDPNLERSHLYMAPEREHTVEADIYSVCATLYHMATRQHPPPSSENIDRVKEMVASGLREFNRSLYEENSGIADIIARGLRWKEHGRTPDTEKLLEDIDLFDPRTASIQRNPRSLLDAISGKVSSLEIEEPIFARMVGVRLRQLDRYLDEMLLGIHDVRGDHETLVMTIAQYLSVCEPDDQYLTASVPWLWYTENMGVNGRLRSMNKEVIKRGTTLRRVFVLTEKDLTDPRTTEVLQAHAEMLDEIESEGFKFNTKDKDIASGGVFTGVLRLSEEERERRFRRNPHSGIWIRDTTAKVLLPFYDEEPQKDEEPKKRLTGIRLRSGDGKPNVLRRNFERDFLAGAQEIRDFLRSTASDPNRHVTDNRLIDRVRDRYVELVDKKFITTLSSEEEAALARLRKQLEDLDAVAYQETIKRLKAIRNELSSEQASNPDGKN